MKFIDNAFIFHKIGENDVEFFASDIPTDDTVNPRYYGFISGGGSWIIIEFNETNGTFRYAFGQSDYSTNWTNRAGLTYGLFHEMGV